MAPVALSEGSDGFFISPEGGWSVAQRVYSAIYGNVLAGQQVVVTDSHTPAPAATQVEPEPESMDPMKKRKTVIFCKQFEPALICL